MKNNSIKGAKPTHVPANDNNELNKQLPVPVNPEQIKPSLSMNTIPAHFVSQLLAERARLAIQRPKRRAPVSLATRAYNTARQIAIKRMPTGFGFHSSI